MTFTIEPGATAACGGGDYWWETYSASDVFEVCGNGTASVEDPAMISGTFYGTFHYNKAAADRQSGHYWSIVQYCQAPDHQFTLTKR